MSHKARRRPSWKKRKPMSLAAKDVIAGLREVLGLLQDDFDMGRVIQAKKNDAVLLVRFKEDGEWTSETG